MNQSQKEYFSKIEKKYGIKCGKYETCPVCGLRGVPDTDNFLVMEHDVIGSRGLTKHRWSFASGRLVQVLAEDTNIL